MSYSPKSPLTVREARKTLGKEYEMYSDDQISEILLALHLLAKNEFVYNSSKKVQGITNDT